MAKSKIFIVEHREGWDSRVLPFGFVSFEDAQKFVENHELHPIQVNPMRYRSNNDEFHIREISLFDSYEHYKKELLNLWPNLI